MTNGRDNFVDKHRERKFSNWGEFWYYKERSFYYEALKAYFDAFGKENFAVYLFDDLKSDTSSLMTNIYDFLDVSTDFNAQLKILHNVSGVPKNRLIHDLFAWDSMLTKISKVVVPRRIREHVRSTVMSRNLSNVPLDAEAKNRLLRIFRNDVIRTQDLIGRDLSHWLVEFV